MPLLSSIQLTREHEDSPRRRVAFSPRLRILFRLTLLALVIGGLWWGRAPLLRGIAKLWIVADTPQKADAIVILGGGVDSRPEVAAQLYHQGLAPRILIMQPNPTIIEKLGLVIDDVIVTRKYLEMEHVPAEAIQLLEPNVTSTFEEANVLAAWAHDHGGHRFLVPTDLFHTRRARWILRRQLQPLGADALMIPVRHRKFTADNWWRAEEGVISFQNETVKFAMYLFRY